jgi:glycosyltransferase involved in cell wall biosynthesis
MNADKKKVFIFSSAHFWNDGRVFYRESKSLAKKYKVELHAVADFNFREVDGINVYGLPLWSKPSDRFSTIFILIKRILKSNTDVFHFHDPELLAIVPLIKIIKQKPIIFDVHEHFSSLIYEKEYIPIILRPLFSKLYSIFERLIFPFLDFVIYTTDFIGVRYKKYFGEKAFKVSNLPSISLFKNDPPKYSERSNIAIYMGYMTFVRGIKEIINAFKIVNEKFPEFELHIVGRFFSEEFQKEIYNIISELKMESVIKIKNGYKYEKMNKILYHCKIAYITYLTFPNNIACLPNKLFEYMGAGLAIVASDFDNYREIVVKNNCGVVVKPEDTLEIANATLKYIENEQFATKMSNNARRNFLSKFNWESEEKSFLEFYQKIL